MKKHTFLPCLIFFLILSNSIFAGPIIQCPVDISLLIVDLKYNKEQGVKVCEIQPVSYSNFTGSESVRGYGGYVADKIWKLLSEYQEMGWVVGGQMSNPHIAKAFLKNGWGAVSRTKNLDQDSQLNMIGRSPIEDPYSLRNYHGIVYKRFPTPQSFYDFKSKYPSAIPIDAAAFSYTKNKHAMSLMFKNDPELEHFKPTWNRYKKYYDKKLVRKIISEINSDLFVIKPLREAKGEGVIIVDKEHLDETLKCIFKNQKKAKKHPDPAYRYWADCYDPFFIVEEFIPSDLINVPHLNNLPYDPTARFVFALIYDEKQIQLIFLENFWKLPRKSLVENGTLNEQYKTCLEHPYYHAITPDTAALIEAQLTEMLIPLYKKMLNLKKELLY